MHPVTHLEGRHLKSNAVSRQSQHGVTKGKSCLHDLTPFYDKWAKIFYIFYTFCILERLLVLPLAASFRTSCPAVR